MRLQSIEILNFRQYQKLEIAFPKNTPYDMHLIIADNGVGKTNILNAITWCLYDAEPHLGDASRSLPRFNLRAKESLLLKGETTGEISVKITMEDDGDCVVFHRKESVLLKEDTFSKKSTITVVINTNGDAKIYEDTVAGEYIQKYMPEKIRQYFYFDGEQLETYFVSSESAKIKESIHAISSVETVTKIAQRLQRVITTKKVEAGKTTPKIADLNRQIEANTEELKKKEEEIERLVGEIDLSTNIIKRNSDYLSGQENLPKLEEEYQRLKQRQIDFEERKKQCEQELFGYLRKMKVALSFYACAKETLALIAEKQAASALPPSIDQSVLKDMLGAEHNKCMICNHTLDDAAKTHIEELLKKIQVSSATSNLLMEIRSKLVDTVDMVNNYPLTSKTMKKKHKDVCQDLKMCEDELEGVDNQLSKFTDKTQVAGWHKERTQHEELLKINRDKKAVAMASVEKVKLTIEQLEGKLETALDEDKKLKQLNARIKFASNAQDIVLSIENEMMTEVRSQMEKQTMEYFNVLIWKKGVYNHISLDEKYQLDLIHRDGYSCVGSCSAAERSLLALSFTLALHKVSGFEVPLFIDTPVARVSGDNRKNFANVLKDVSQDKQLIMAFTKDEYSENIKTVFDGIASTSVQLSMNSSNDITTTD